MCLKANANKLYHLGLDELIANSTLIRVNENRSYRIYEQFTMLLIQQAKQLYFGDNDLEGLLKNVFAIDATTIDLCLSIFTGLRFAVPKAV